MFNQHISSRKSLGTAFSTNHLPTQVQSRYNEIGKRHRAPLLSQGRKGAKFASKSKENNITNLQVKKFDSNVLSKNSEKPTRPGLSHIAKNVNKVIKYININLLLQNSVL